ncbi:uncharacterized protein UDID_17118 [Ustilago sp. UG-2017a]|nr:uncharacterized protein UDID_17118 [Ustilago sp. UG-2017a]
MTMLTADPGGIHDINSTCADLGEICHRADSTTDLSELGCRSHDLPDSLIPALPSYELTDLLTSCASSPMTNTSAICNPTASLGSSASMPQPQLATVPSYGTPLAYSVATAGSSPATLPRVRQSHISHVPVPRVVRAPGSQTLNALVGFTIGQHRRF